MIVYWCLLVYSYLVYFFIRGKGELTDRKRKSFLILSGIPMIFCMGLRSSSVGVDTVAYTRNFEIICDLKWTDFGVEAPGHGNAGHYEFGYYYLNKIVGMFTKEPQVLLFIAAIMIVGVTFLAIYLLSDNVLLSVTMFQTFGFYCYAIALMRQFLAIPIILISYYYFVNKNYVKTFIFIIIASLFHASALVFVPIYLFLSISQRLKKFCFLVTIAICIILPKAYQIIITYVPRYKFYQTYEAQEYISAGIFAIFIMGLLLVPFILKRNIEVLYKNKENSYLIQLLIMGVAINLLASKIAMLGRIVYMFTIFIIIYIPKMLNLLNNKGNKRVLLYTIFGAQFVYYFNFLYHATARVCPYLFFWQ